MWHSLSYNVCIGVASVNSDELSSFCKVVVYPQPDISSDSKVVQLFFLFFFSFSFCSNILCDTVSKALVKSTNDIPTKIFLSAASLHLSVRCIKSCSVDFPFL